ncbi:hypothetical protein CC85DRAFT_331062 [Cutaneotrichosporon oleaginosum]|uniref:Uncharacterized protein n=1 Tax=Cutaneotrichosporon oleaginosum TaxID=879819 RepID=A0A0J0XDH7_9TREE|nr:uncharacterized protein CC85DRAFT_331062 [Cutaneotrichosporon oleaginosum]KLT39093.1 hypothetical protein CC85DRAFT_331062 [Cutaneotrichosporon oleaginosum]TXT08515.1 hypothetical protein COLE_05439 [Cutaneotrichosporon oleaginosum]
MSPETDFDAIHDAWRAIAQSGTLTEEQSACLLGARCLRIISAVQDAPPESPGPKASMAAIIVAHNPSSVVKPVDSSTEPKTVPDSPPSPSPSPHPAQPRPPPEALSAQKSHPQSLPTESRKVKFAIPARPPPSPTRQDSGDAASRFRERLARNKP